MTVTGSTIADNVGAGISAAVSLSSARPAAYGFPFNAVVDNGSGTLAGDIDCGTTHLIDSSIVVRNSTAGTTQFTGNCVFNHVAAGADSATGIVPGPAPVFVSGTKTGTDLHLVPSSSNNAASCIDRAVDAMADVAPSLPRSDHDFDGAPRPRRRGPRHRRRRGALTLAPQVAGARGPNILRPEFGSNASSDGTRRTFASASNRAPAIKP